MADTAEITRLGELAAQINEAHRACEKSAREAVLHAVQAGKLLNKAKRQCGHGGWWAWVDENCQFLHRTAQVYMRIAREVPKLPGSEAQRVAHLSLRDTVRLLAAPKPDTDSFGSLYQYIYDRYSGYTDGIKRVNTWADDRELQRRYDPYQIGRAFDLFFQACERELASWNSPSDAARLIELGHMLVELQNTICHYRLVCGQRAGQAIRKLEPVIGKKAVRDVAAGRGECVAEARRQRLAELEAAAN